MRIFFLFYLLLVTAVFSQTQLFTSAGLTFSSGVHLPLGRLASVLKPQTTMGVSFKTPYYKPFWCLAGIQYAWLYGPDAPRDYNLIRLGLGLEWQSKILFIPRLGASFSNFTIKATSREVRYKFLSDEFESEFGLNCWISLPVVAYRSFGIMAKSNWDIIFSQPRYSHFLNFQIGVIWQLW